MKITVIPPLLARPDAVPAFSSLRATPGRRHALRLLGAAAFLGLCSFAATGRLSAQTTLNFEAESLSYTPSGATASVQTDANSSGGHWVMLAGNSVGDNISYTLPNVPAGTYSLRMEWKGLGSRGILQLSVDGSNVGPTLDQYSAGAVYPTTTFGTVTFASAGSHTIRLTVTGKNAKSSNYQLSADKFTLVGQALTAAAAPVFSPGGGTYGSAQAVAITSSTAGASIRYTTDGSTPSETAGTIYSGPVSISSGTVTLKAIAYESGLADSSVTSAAYTIGTGGTGGGTAASFEAEGLTYTPSGATASVQTDANSSGGHWVMLSGNSVGDHIDYAIPAVQAGTYQLQMEWKGLGSRGILQLSVDGSNVGPTLDQYSAGATYPTTTFGTVSFGSTGTHTIRLTVTGKNAKSSNYQLSADKFIFTPTGGGGPQQVATPSFSPGAGTYTTAQNVTVTTATSGASIRYTVDGSTPSATAGTVYSGPVSIASSTTLKAVAYENGFTDSSVASALYTIASGGGGNVVTLFDGTSFDGWTQKPLNSWKLDPPNLAMASVGAGRGFIYANNKYQFYRLRFEIRHISGNPNHNACVLFFGTSPSLDAMGGIQFQLPNGGDWDYRPGVNKGGGPHFTTLPHPTVDPAQWSSVELLVDGRNGTARMAVAQPVGAKATEVIDFKDPTDAVTGYFAFQMHNSGLFDEYRNVTIEVNPAVDDLITTK